MVRSHVLIILVLFILTPSVHAQTKPASKTKKSTKTSTKPVAKKAAPKPVNYYLCTSAKDIYYHKYSSCAGLNKCAETIKNIKSASELKKFKKQKSCIRCFNK